MSEVYGYHVTIPGRLSCAFWDADVLVEHTRTPEGFWDEGLVRASVGWFETRAKAIRFAREVFEPLGYSVDY